MVIREYEKITPDYKPHINLENDVISYLESKNFMVADATYHNVMPGKIKSRLSSLFTPTSIYIRSRSDRVALHIHKQIVFQIEFKTHASKKFNDMTLEIMPIFYHLQLLKLGTECLYCFRNSFENINVGFWVKDLPPVEVIMIPPRWEKYIKEWFLMIIKNEWPSAKVISLNKNCGGSNDPFLIVKNYYLKKMRHWKELIDERLDYEEKMVQENKKPFYPIIINGQQSFYEAGTGNLKIHK